MKNANAQALNKLLATGVQVRKTAVEMNRVVVI